MTSDEFGAALTALGVSPAVLADVLQVNPREVRRWLAGSAPVPRGVAAFMRVAVAVAGRTAPRDLAVVLRAEAHRLDV
jgi:DNA-binding transcriptional regulator YiaG